MSYIFIDMYWKSRIDFILCATIHINDDATQQSKMCDLGLIVIEGFEHLNDPGAVLSEAS